MAVATGLIDDLEKPVGELVLEVIVVEMDRNKHQVPRSAASADGADLRNSIERRAATFASQGLTGLIGCLSKFSGNRVPFAGLTPRKSLSS